MTTARLMALEVRRLFSSRRWLVAVVVCVLASWLSASSVGVAVANSGVGASVADIYLALVNNLTLVGYLLLPTFALVACGTLAADRTTGYAALVFTRAGRRHLVWHAKGCAVVAAAAALQLMVLASAVVAGLASGLPFSRAPSALALLVDAEGTPLLFAPALSGDDMLLRIAATAVFLTLAFSAVGVVAMAVSVRMNKEHLPPALVLGVIFGDWLVVRFSAWEAYDRVSPSLHLMESTHRLTVSEPVWWGASIAYFSVLLAIAWIAGEVALRHVDL